MIGVPAFVLIFSGIRLMLGEKTRYRRLGGMMTGLWFAGLIMLIYVSVSIGRSFSYKETVKENIVLQTQTDTLKLEANILYADETDKPFHLTMNDKLLFAGKDDETISVSFAQLDVAKSESGEYEILIKKSARGKNRSGAAKRASSIQYNLEEKDNSLIVTSHFDISKNDKYRAQDIEMTLLVPEGKTIFLSSGMEKIIYDIKNTTNTFDHDMIGHYWTMTAEGLTCNDCNFSSGNLSSSQKGISYDLDGYNEIIIDGNLNVEISQGDNYSFTVTGNEKFAQNFNAQKDGNQLKIASDFKWKNISLGSKKGTVHIVTPVLHRIEVNGINQVNINGFKTDNLDIEINGASKNKFNVDVKSLTLELNGASKAELKGSADNAKIESAGASDIEALNFKIKNCKVDLAGASKATMNVADEFDINLAGASVLKYKGSPKIVSDVSGGSSVSRME
jgi:hypothetical protein